MGPKNISQTIFICITTSRWRTCCQGVYICTHFNDTIILQSISVYQFDLTFLNAASETSKLIPDSAVIFQTIVPRYLMPVLLKSNFTEGICKWWARWGHQQQPWSQCRGMTHQIPCIPQEYCFPKLCRLYFVKYFSNFFYVNISEKQT